MRIGRSVWSRPQYSDLTYMRGTGFCAPMSIIFGSIVENWHISLNIKFGANWTFHVPKTPVYRFDYYVRYRTLWTNEDNFWYYY